VGGPLLGEGRPGRRGRPAKHYRAAAPASGPAGYAGLAGALAAELALLAPDPQHAGQEAGRNWARQTLGARPAPVSAADARRRVLAELEDLGFAVEAARAHGGDGTAEASAGEGASGTAEAGGTEEASAGEETVRLVACPLLSAARDQPGVVCSVHAGLVGESLRLLGHPGLSSRLEPFAEPGACLLTIGRPRTGHR
jgi:predicted ArsR family transcriptional regulator